MKSLKESLTNICINESGLTPAMKHEIESKQKEIKSILNKMDLGDFDYADRFDYLTRINLFLKHSTRYSWSIEPVFDETELEFGSISSWGSFTFNDDDTLKYYKSIGIILSQEKELKQIEALLLEISRIIKEASK